MIDKSPSFGVYNDRGDVDMKNRVIIFSIIAAIAAAGFFAFVVPAWDTMPPNYIRIVQPQQGPDHLNLLLTMQGRADFNFRGEGGFAYVTMYVAYFYRDELILHEAVAGMGLGVDDADISGSILWGIATPQAFLQEFRVQLMVNGSSAQGSFDLSRLDFQPMLTAGPNFTNEQIVQGQRYVVQMKNTSGRFSAQDQFDPEVLRHSENTAIFYVIFQQNEG